MALPLRALIVEDSEDDAVLLVRELKRGGFDVEHMRVDSSATMNVALDRRCWDIVISDYSMPGFSGAEALKILRARTSEVPFIYVSGTLGEDTAVAALKSGAQDYLVKGKLGRLVPAIERELRDVETRRERQRLETQIHQLRRFEAIGRLAGGIAHDFNNLIGAILGFAELGQEELADDHPTRKRLQKICEQAKRAGALTHQLLAFARRQVIQPRNLDINTVIKETISLLGRLIGEHIRIEPVLSDDLAPAWADGTQVEQVIMNLCLNARDAMPQGGRITIRTRNFVIRPGDAVPQIYYRAGNYVLVTIADTGIGMNQETLEHIFEPFFTTKEVGKGTGLGLPTVYGIVKQHGGIVDVESKLGVGTEFRVYLPIGSGAPEASEKKTEPVVTRGSETILVAEDNDGLRELAKEVLESLGYHVLLAATGDEALEIFAPGHKSIDLALLDIIMPETGGPAALEKMLAIKPSLRAIFMTGYTAEMEAERLMGEMGVPILRKPYSSQELAQSVRSVLDEAR
ncbi:MAG TPA: response regulator [Candidatus Acidoferrales bacterium]|nr:response regulator [Candidatus Acidoferrales bacterium]